MKITTAFLTVLWIACVGIGLSGCRTADDRSDMSAGLDYILDGHPEFFGVALVARQGAPLYLSARGFRDPLQQVPSDTAAVFELASVSKVFTSAVILQLVQDRRIRLEDSLRYFFPELPYQSITIRHLLSHTSGLPDYQAIMDSHWDKTRVAGNEDCLEFLARYHPPANFRPGQQYEYSNSGYLILASIAEQVTGKPFRELLKERVFRPAGMTLTDIRTAAEKRNIPAMAWGFVTDSTSGRFVSADSLVSSNYTVWLGNRRGPGRVSSTARDLLRFDRAFFGGKILSDSIRHVAMEQGILPDGKPTEYGLGWEIRKPGEIFGHSGNNPGYRTLFLHHHGRQECIILLSNNAFDDLEKIAGDFGRRLGWDR